MIASELFSKAGIKCPRNAENIEITEIVTDSRRVREGSLFVCIKGLHFDGHERIGDAIKAGAAVIVAEQVRDDGVGGAAAVYVENTRRAAALLYNAWHGDPSRSMTVVAVTGTNGKTSLCYILKSIFERAGFRCGLIGTVRCMSGDRVLQTSNSNPLANMTTPDPDELYRLLSVMRDDGAEYVFIEATSHALALSKLDALTVDTAVLTNFTRDHLDFHGSMEEYFKAKARLFGMCRRAVINADSAWAEKFTASADCKEIFTVSAKTSADFSAESVEYLKDRGVRYDFNYGEGRTEMSISLPGKFFLDNSLEAAAVAYTYGIAPSVIAEAVVSFGGVDGRMERVSLGENADISVFIDYAHTPDAVENLLKSVRAFRENEQRIVLLFGCGGERDRSKRREMAQIASRLADFVIITSDNSRGEAPEQIFSDILKGMDKEKEFALIEDRRAAIEYAVFNSKKKDVIILAGKGHERYEINALGRLPFDEREIVRSAYARYKAIYY